MGTKTKGLIIIIRDRGLTAYFCSMNSLSKRVKAFLQGFITTISLFIVLSLLGVIRIEPTYVVENLLIFGFWWMAFSFLFANIPYLKKNRNTVYKVLGLLGLLILIFLIDNFLDIQDSPITFPLLILFWIGVAYMVLPNFFKKYRIVILTVYGVVLAYFLVFRASDDYFSAHQERIINSLLIPIPIFAVLWVYEQWRWLKILQTEKGKAELALLKNQINPHFFFNTLNNLYGLVVEKSDKAPEVVLKLSDMMRYIIYDGKEDVVQLTDEIEYLENYIELHRIRYQKEVEILFNKQIERDYSIAPLLFIILLENAFKHGVESMTQDAYVHIKLIATGNQVSFWIVNNFEEDPQKQSLGIGLDNLKKRLEHIYPQQYTLQLEKQATTYSAQLTIMIHD